MSIKMFILWNVCFLCVVQRFIVQAQVSGNAIDLANMNMNMMQTKCPLEPCQSACLVEHPETGCFICDPNCNSGSNLMHMQPMNSGQAGFYTGCEHDNWMQCPMSCARKFDQKGCFRCECQATRKLQGTTKQTSILTAATKILDSTDRITVPSIVTTSESSPSTLNLSKSTTAAVTTRSTTTEKPVSKTLVTLETETFKSQFASKITQESHPQTEFPLNHDRERNTTSPAIENKKDLVYQNTNLPENGDFKPNNLAFILFGIMIVLATFCLVFLISWRRSSRKLKRNKNELYFVHKAYRQDSNARLSTNEMMDPVYADIGPRPEPPSRGPPNVRIDTMNTGPLRSLSQSSETPLKEHSDDFKHDYLELI